MQNVNCRSAWPSKKYRLGADYLYDPKNVYDVGKAHAILVGRSGISVSPSRSEIINGPDLRTVYAECAVARPTVSTNPRVLRGKPCVTRTRIPVALVLRYLATGEDPIEDLDLTSKDISDCLEYAAMVCDYAAIPTDYRHALRLRATRR